MASHIGTDFTACPFESTRTGNKDDIVPTDDVAATFRKGGSYYTPDTVAVYGVAKGFFARRNSDATASRTVTHNVGNKCGTDKSFSSSVKASEIPVFLQSVFQDDSFRYIKIKDVRSELIRKLLSALCSAAGKHLAAVSRRHSLAETVFLLAVKLFGLIGSEHYIPLRFFPEPNTRIIFLVVYLKSGNKPPFCKIRYNPAI